MTVAILDNGLHAPEGVLQYAWFKLATPQGERYRCIALRELSSIPIAAREDYDLLGKQWAAVRGLYNAGVDFLYSAAGVFTPEHVGIVQYYGAAAEDLSLTGAAERVQAHAAAVAATLAASYPQSITRPPELRWVEWYVEFIIHRSRNVLALLGHPDPRETRRGLGKEGELPNDTGEDLAAEQNELLFRGLAKLREDFIFQVTAERLGRLQLSQALVRVAQAASNVASRRRGSIGIGFSVSLPLLAAVSGSQAGGVGRADSQAQNTSEGASHGWGQSHTDSVAHTDSRSQMTGGSVTDGTAKSHAVSQSDSTAWSHSDSRAHTDSASHTDSRSHTDSQSVTQSSSVSQGVSQSQSQSQNWSQGQSQNWSQGQSQNWAQGQSQNWSQGVSQNWSQGQSQNWSQSAGQSASETLSQSQTNSVNAGLNGGVNLGGSAGLGEVSPLSGKLNGGVTVGGSVGAGHSWGESASQGATTSQSTSVGGGESASLGGGLSSSSGGGQSSSYGGGSSSSVGGGSSSSVGGASSTSTGTSTTTSQGTAVSQGSADSYGVADSVGKADSVGASDSTGGGRAQGVSDTITKSHSVSKSWATTTGSSDTTGSADGTSENWGVSHAAGQSLGVALSRSASQALSGGFSAGLAPGVSISRSWQTEDDVAERVTEVLRQLEALLNAASAEGGFLTSALLFTASETGATAAEALVPQAFHGPHVPTPVLTVRPDGADSELLRQQAWAFLPARLPDPADTLFQGLLGEKYSTLQSCPMVSAYTAPALIEEGTAVTVMPPIPADMGFLPLMPGEVVLGHQVSPTTRDLTAAPLRLDQGRLMHTLFAGDTGFGKSVAAMRMAYETTLKWKLRTVVLDFGAGWRQLLNAQGLQGHVDILQLWPNAARPLRWNPLQIGRNIDPETQWRAFADIFGSIARLGVRRQKQELLEALRQIYIRNGVLVDDPLVREHTRWGAVQPEEEGLIGVAAGEGLGSLTPQQRQALAVSRSAQVGLKDLYDEVKSRLAGVPAKDAVLSGVLEGILFRLNPLVQGAAAAQFAPGEDALEVADLGKGANGWGVAIIEGGMFLDDFGKAFLLGWIGWHLYTDMVARRVHEVNDGEPLLQIFFEEANKIFAGAEAGGGEDEGGGVSASQRFGDMFRDARKYKARLHVITQAPHMLPADIVSSCNNLVIAFLKNPKDKDLVLSALARSEKGFRDEEWRRFVSDMPIGLAIGRFPYTAQRELQRAVLFRPLQLEVREPSDAEIEQRLGRLAL